MYVVPFEAGHDIGVDDALALALALVVKVEVESVELALLLDTLAVDEADVDAEADIVVEEELEDPAFATSLAPQIPALFTAAPSVLFR